jgi:hypothetical protein
MTLKILFVAKHKSGNIDVSVDEFNLLAKVLHTKNECYYYESEKEKMTYSIPPGPTHFHV